MDSDAPGNSDDLLLDSVLTMAGNRTEEPAENPSNLDWTDVVKIAEFISWRGGKSRNAAGQTALGRHIGLACFDLDDSPTQAVVELGRILQKRGSDTIELEPDPEVFPYPFTVCNLEPDERDPTALNRAALEKWVTVIASQVRRWPQLGASIHLSRGMISKIGPVGAAMAGAKSPHCHPEPGVLKLSATVAAHLSKARLEAITSWFSPGRCLVLRGEADNPMAEQAITGLATEACEAIRRVRLTVAVQQGKSKYRQRAASPFALTRSALDPQPILRHGDTLSLRFQCPDPLFIYAALQRGGGLTLLNEGKALRASSGPTSGGFDWVVDDLSSTERPLIIAANRPLTSLRQVVAAYNLGQGRHQGMDALTKLMRALVQAHRSEEGGDVGLGLLYGRSFTHEGGVSGDDAYRSAGIAAYHEGRIDQALRDLSRSVRHSPLGKEQLRARLFLARTLLRLQRPHAATELLRALEMTALQCGDLSTAGDAARIQARILIDRNRAPQAAKHLERAFDWHRLVGDRSGEGWDHLQQAVSFWMRGAYGLAQETYRVALSIARGVGEPRLLAAAYLGNGQIAHELGELEQAELNLNEAMSHYVRCQDSFGELRTLGELGLLSLQTGRPQAALRYFSHQTQLATATRRPITTARALVNQAMALIDNGRPADAKNRLLQCLPLIHSERHWVLKQGVALLRGRCALLLSDTDEAAEHLLSLNPSNSNLPLTLRWEIALAQGALMDAIVSPNAEATYRLGIEAIEEVRRNLRLNQRSEFMNTSQALWRGWIGHHVSRRAPGDQVLAAIDRSRARTFLDALMLCHPDVEFTKSSVLNPTDPQDAMTRVRALRQQLPENTAIWAIQLLDTKALVLWADRDGVSYGLTRNSRREVESHAEALRRMLSNPRLAGNPSPHLRALSQMLMSPIIDRVKATHKDSTVICLPDGLLHGLPLHALPHPSGGSVVDHLATCYAPSLSAIAQWLRIEIAPCREVCVFADPHDDLPHARQEAALVQEAIGPAVTFLGRQVTPLRFLAACERADVIHAAVHAVRRRGPEPAALRLCPPRMRPLPSLTEPPQPMDEGQVGIPDLARLKVRAQLVTLSACEAGGGTLSRAGDGPDVLSWAFLASGARAVVASGWVVPDADTAVLMGHFYRELAGGANKALALARAQRALRGAAATFSNLRPPDDIRRWAAFSLTGDPRPLAR